MASNLSFVEYVLEQSSGAGEMTCKKMFGEYGVYCNGKIIGVICNNVLFVKKTLAGAAVCPSIEEGTPYYGAKPHFVVENIDDKEQTARFIRATYNELPPPKPKKKK